jgi:hypothetical protein
MDLIVGAEELRGSSEMHATSARRLMRLFCQVIATTLLVLGLLSMRARNTRLRRNVVHEAREPLADF